MELLAAFDHAAIGNPTLMLVAGFSGTGKSALVYEVHRPITARKGYFVSGKFDQFQRTIPYYALLNCFREFVDLNLEWQRPTPIKTARSRNNNL